MESEEAPAVGATCTTHGRAGAKIEKWTATKNQAPNGLAIVRSERGRRRRAGAAREIQTRGRSGNHHQHIMCSFWGKSRIRARTLSSLKLLNLLRVPGIAIDRLKCLALPSRSRVH